MIRQRLARALVAATGSVLATLAAGTVLLLRYTQHTAMRTAETVVENAALVIENTINRQFLQVDGALVSLPELLAAANGNGPVDRDAATRILRGINFQTFLFRDLLLLGHDGGLWAEARSDFRGHSLPVTSAMLSSGSHPGAVTIAGPARNPITGDWALYFARPITLIGVGRFEAMAEVPVPLVTELLSASGKVPGLRISLERGDGQVLASFPQDERIIGRRPATPIRPAHANGIAFQARSAPGGDVPIIAVVRQTLYNDVARGRGP